MARWKLPDIRSTIQSIAPQVIPMFEGGQDALGTMEQRQGGLAHCVSHEVWRGRFGDRSKVRVAINPLGEEVLREDR